MEAHLSWSSMPQIKHRLALALLPLACAACASAGPRDLGRPDRALLAADLAHTRPAGLGTSFRPAATSAAIDTGRPVGPWRCHAHSATSYGVHVELFAERRGIVVPAGIGVSHPVRSQSYVVSGRCLYPLRTTEPTGVVQVAASRGHLEELFELWGQPLTATRLGGFSGPVTAYVDGKRWRGDPRRIPLRRHTQIVLEIGGYVPPHATYGFPSGL
jgi:hypothetical protein